MKNILLTPLKLAYLLLMVLKSCLSIITLFIYIRLERLYKFATEKRVYPQLTRREQQEQDVDEFITRSLLTFAVGLMLVIGLVLSIDAN
tara:strand:- start:30 stop:296 length:267 start_codon:yes stop_codon:yes gene_type:complete